MSLVQRNEEVAVLDELLADSLRERSRVAIIGGDVATGKSTLLCTLEEKARDRGAVFLGAIASPLETDLAAGVLEQLFRSPELPDSTVERAARLLNAHALPPLEWFRGMWDVLRGLTEHRPVVIGVDDVHHADEISLKCLLYLVRRLRSARLLTVLTVRPRPDTASAPLYTEFLHEPHSRRMELGPLSADGVTALLCRHLDVATARRLAPAFHEASAGNPALVHALVDDHLTRPEQVAPQRVAGGAFGRAVVGFLRRHDFPVLEVARAIAVLNKPMPPRLLGMLLDIDAESAARAVATLTSARILDGGCFRHGVARTAVADGAPAGERRSLHLRAAALLRAEGAAAAEVAEHIVAANHDAAPWAIPILREAAEQALTGDDLDTGIRYLRAAHQMCGDERQRAVIASVLADAEWRIDPSTVPRRLPEFSLAVRENLLDGRYAVGPLASLLWQGRVSEALHVLDMILQNESGTTDDERRVAVDPVSPRLWPSYLYPELVHPGSPKEAATRPGGSGPAPADAEQDPATLLVAGLHCGDVGGALAAAERILERSRLHQRTFFPLSIALATLVYGDRPARAAVWCDSLLDEAAARRSPTWLALFTALRSLIHLRKGELTAAEDRAEAAWSLIPPKSWGVTVGLPLSCLILTRTLTGGQRDVADLLDIAVPEAMFRTPMGQHYLYARGRHHLAAERFHAALHDFRACGTVRGACAPVEPWRLGAAEALIALGDRLGARRLADEQLAIADPAHVRTRGMALRVKAATHDLRDRPALLEQAVRLLDGHGDRLELSYALADLSDLWGRLGEHERARETAHRAAALARRCGVPFRSAGRDGEDSDNPFLRLSDAERRVASLAANGYTNREISKKLYITISTVEQHLTKVYRKLNVKRFDLKSALQDGGIVMSQSEPALDS